MKHVLHRAAPPVLKDIASDNSICRVIWGLIVFVVLVIVATIVVMTPELVVASALIACCASAINAWTRLPSSEQ